MSARIVAAGACLGLLVLGGCSLGSQSSASAPAPAKGGSVPRPDHVVVVVMENRAYRDLLGARNAPYINALARSGATFSRSFALTHPSEPNYLALFSGSTHHVFGDPCPLRLGGPNLASELMDAGLSFGGYSEGLPRKGSRVCVAGRYARKHVPWVNFHAVPRGVSKPFTRFPDDYSALPDVSFVIPDLCHDMHDCSIATGDQWLRRHMRAYAAWAQAHSSLLVLTWDEDDGSSNNHILTAIAGAGVMPGRYPEKIDHYSVLRTIEDMYGLGHAGHAAEAQPIADIWR